MKRLTLTILLMLTASCNQSLTASNTAATTVLCEATAEQRVRHADALLIDAGELAKATGATLLSTLKIGCTTDIGG